MSFGNGVFTGCGSQLPAVQHTAVKFFTWWEGVGAARNVWGHGLWGCSAPGVVGFRIRGGCLRAIVVPQGDSGTTGDRGREGGACTGREMLTRVGVDGLLEL